MPVVAFVPVRGGSKSIPLKNIKMIAGHPLVYWVLKSLNDSSCTDRVVVATDSEEIKRTVIGFRLGKVEVYDRASENAVDTASTESVMLEYLKNHLCDDDTFILIQATSPFTTSDNIDQAVSLFKTGTFDSILSCVRFRRFIWENNCTPINYDYKHRPRRQEYEGLFMENGAIYISKVANIKESANRLSGKIGIYEMPEYSATEIDEVNDWIIVEKLLIKYRPETSSQKVRLVLTDVDGVLTDSGMYYTSDGTESKKFNTRDGVAFRLLQEAGIAIGMITSEQTSIVENRAKKLKVNYLFQGRSGTSKLEAAKEICAQEGVGLEDIAYVGDDINCRELLESVGHAFCPSNAHSEILELGSVRVLETKGGEGVLRELYDFLLKMGMI